MLQPESELLADVLAHAHPLGHREQPSRLNIGFGFVYYGLVRALRPNHIIVIGSGFGFSVACLALGLKDNDAGQLTFVDPSYSLLRNGPLKTVGGVNNWSDPEATRQHFARFGVDKYIEHHKLTAEAFFAQYDNLKLPSIDLAFIDGNHSYKNVKHDFLQTLRHSHKNTYMLLHDTNIYVREMIRHSGVKRWLKALRSEKNAFEFVDFPFDSGVALIRVVEPKVWQQV
jgi:predicted O-methyltransferase YrrM